MGRYLAFLRQTGIRPHEPNENQVPPERTPFPVPKYAPLCQVRESRVFHRRTFHI